MTSFYNTSADPSAMERLKDCIRERGQEDSSPEKLATLTDIAFKASPEPWRGILLALLCEGLEVYDINRMLSQVPDVQREKWQKWRLEEVRFPWDQKKGDKMIREFAFSLLMPDLINIYTGYTDSSGVTHSPEGIPGVCKTVKLETGITIIK
jgi:hypothetical protein